MAIEITAIDVRVEKLSLSGVAGAVAFMQRTGVSNAFTGNFIGSPVVGIVQGVNAMTEAPGLVIMIDIRSMVDGVLGRLALLRKLKSDLKMCRLNILDHGDKSKIEIGSDKLTGKNIGAQAGQLGRLRGQFEADGFIHLQQYEAGTHEPLMIALARIVGVQVYAGTGNHNSIYRFNTGEYVRANPDESFDRNVDRP